MNALVLIPVLIFSIVVHEVAHAWQARREGDDTAEKLGRITLNPLPHLDFFGSFLVPAALYLSGTGLLFGWAKPVPTNPRNFTARWAISRTPPTEPSHSFQSFSHFFFSFYDRVEFWTLVKIRLTVSKNFRVLMGLVI